MRIETQWTKGNPIPFTRRFATPNDHPYHRRFNPITMPSWMIISVLKPSILIRTYSQKCNPLCRHKETFSKFEIWMNFQFMKVHYFELPEKVEFASRKQARLNDFVQRLISLFDLEHKATKIIWKANSWFFLSKTILQMWLFK